VDEKADENDGVAEDGDEIFDEFEADGEGGVVVFSFSLKFFSCSTRHTH